MINLYRMLTTELSLKLLKWSLKQSTEIRDSVVRTSYRALLGTQRAMAGDAGKYVVAVKATELATRGMRNLGVYRFLDGGCRPIG